MSPGCEDATCNPPGPSFVLADTRQMHCYEDDSYMMSNCPGVPGEMSCEGPTNFCGQDAQYGWDTLHSNSSDRWMNDNADEPVVTDTVTGLVWQGCASGLNGSLCKNGTAKNMTWTDALDYCNALPSSWGGFDDWRLPDYFELQSIIDAGRHTAAADPTAFPGMDMLEPWREGFHYWSSTSTVNNASHAWLVNFDSGFVTEGDKAAVELARCVHSGPSPMIGKESPRFNRTGGDQPVVEDRYTRLFWQGCARDQNGSTCAGTSTTHTWVEALAYCESLTWGAQSKSSWRLPNRAELASIVDVRNCCPSIDPDSFPGTPSGGFWSSTTIEANRPNAWVVYFGDGRINDNDKTSGKFYVRCVIDP